MFGQVGLLAEILTAQRTGKRFLSRVRSYVYIDRVLVFEALGANAAVMKQPLSSGSRLHSDRLSRFKHSA